MLELEHLLNRYPWQQPALGANSSLQPGFGPRLQWETARGGDGLQGLGYLGRRVYGLNTPCLLNTNPTS